MISSNITTVISLFDLHYPYNIDLTWIYNFIKDEQPDEIIFWWDMLDCNWMSWKFYSGSPEDGLAETVEEIEGFKKIIKKILKISPQSKLVYLLGNHEHRITEKLRDSPNLGILIDLKRAYDWLISERRDYNEYYNIWKINYTHWTYHNDAHAKKHALMYQKNIRYGHLHCAQEYSLGSPVDERMISSKAIPCLCDLNPGYMKNRPSAWSNWFNIAYIDKKGNFNDYTIIIVNNHFIYNWKKY